MKKALTKVFSLTLVCAMLLGLCCTVLAAGEPVPTGGTVWTPGGTPEVDTSIDVTFVDDDEYDLTKKPGTIQTLDGDVIVSMSTGIIDKDLIPAVDGADDYYAFSTWAVEDKDGKLVPIDIHKYQFGQDTKVYAVMNDLWVPYKDMKQDRSDWFYKYVRDLAIAGVVGGFPDGTFRPQENLTYGQALKLIMLATGYSEQAPTGEHWASGYYAKALEDALTTEADVDLQRPITRREVAEITVQALKLKEPTIETPYADTTLKAALQLFEANIMNGSLVNGDRMFYPEQYITRAEISAVVWRINNAAK